MMYNQKIKTVLTTLLCLFIFSSFISAQTPMQVAGTATITATASGNWSSPNTWGGSLPANDARVLIPSGVTVTVDGMISQEFKSVRIDNGGKLRFATNVNTELRTEYLFSGMMATLEIGTASDKVATGKKASLVFAERGGTTYSQDPQRFAPGAVLMGTTTMHGAEKTSWLTLQEHPSAGATQLMLDANPIGWQVGDKIVIAGTDPITNASITSTNEIGSDEVVTITNISGNSVSFTPALVRDHKPPVQAPDLDVHVANLSRNIVISSENTSVTSISGDFRKPRGHIMFMHTLNVDVKYVEANNLGRTDKTLLLDDWDFEDLARGQNTGSPVPNGGRNPRGRYSFHFHRGGLDESVFPARPVTPLPTPARVEGCVVNTDPGWGYVNHSSRVDFVRNVSYNVTGGAFNTEAGNETGSFKENIAIRTINPQNPILTAPRPRDSYVDAEEATLALSDIKEGRQDFAFQGDGFWLHGTGVTVEGNVVAGCTGHAYVYWTDGLIEKGMGMARGDIDAHVPADEFPTLNQMLKNWKTTYPTFVLDIWYLKSRPFKNNTAYGFARGVQTYYVHTEFHQSDDTESTDPEVWFNDLPGAYKDQLDLVFDGTTLWNIGKVGFEHNHTANVTIQNSRIVGYNCRTGFENYGTNPAPNYVSYEPEVIGLDLDFFHNTHRWNLNNNIIEGFSGNSVGVTLPINAQVTVNGGAFNNSGTDIQIGCPDRRLEEFFGQGMLSNKPTKSDIKIQGNIVFQNPNNNIVMDPQIYYNEIDGKGFPLLGGPSGDETFFFAKQEITFNFGPFNNTRVYYNEQDAGYIPITQDNRCSFGQEPECVSSGYVNKTNTQLQSQFNNSFVGSITPATAVTHPILIGGKVGEISGDPCAGATPTTPSALTASNNGCNSITLTWTAGNCADNYRVQRKVDAGNWVTLSATVNGTSFTDNNPAVGIMTYRVRAQNGNGNSGQRNSNSINCSPNPPTQYTLTTNTAGTGSGTISLNPAGGIYDAGTVVTITATAASDSQFDNWTGGVSGTTNPIIVTMNSNQTVTANFSAVSNGGCSWSLINENGFESGWGIWNDGGSDCRRSINDEDYAADGEYCIRLRDDSNTSVMTTDDMELSNFDSLKIEFEYYCRSMDNNSEGFQFEISTDGGENFTVLKTWMRGAEFENNDFYTDEINVSSITLTNETQLRFRCDGSGNSDWVYIDEVKISGCGNSTNSGNGIIDIVNFSFEEPGVGDFETNFSEIPGWNKSGETDTGVEKGWGDPTDGEWICFHEGGDNFVHQTLSHTIEPGKTYTFKFDVKDLEDSGAKAQVLLRHGSTNIKNIRPVINDEWQTVTVSFNSDDYPNAIGENLRIFFRNNGDEDTYTGFDNFKLNQSEAGGTVSNRLSNLSSPGIRTLRVFPNPIGLNSNLTVDFSGFKSEVIATVFDVNGKMIQQKLIGDLAEISTQNLKPGIYFLKIQDETKTKTTRFLVQE